MRYVHAESVNSDEPVETAPDSAQQIIGQFPQKILLTLQKYIFEVSPFIPPIQFSSI